MPCRVPHWGERAENPPVFTQIALFARILPGEKPVAWRPIGNCPPHVPPRITLAATRGRRPVSKQGRMGWTQPAAGSRKTDTPTKGGRKQPDPLGPASAPRKPQVLLRCRKPGWRSQRPRTPGEAQSPIDLGPWLSNRRGKCDQKRPEWQGERPSFKLTRDSEVRWSCIFIALQTSKCRGPTSRCDLSAP